MEKNEYINFQKEMMTVSDAEIEKQNLVEQVIDNLLLGDFNESGNYVLDSSIVAELIAIPKIVYKDLGNFKFCHSFKKFENLGYINFAIDVTKNSETHQAIAVLVLIEKICDVKNLLEKNNAISIARFVGIGNENFIKRVYRYFNIFNADEIPGVEHIENNKDIDFYNITERIRFLNSLNNLIAPYMNRLERETFKRKEEALEYNELGQSIVDEFGQKLKIIPKNILEQDKPDYYKKVNKLLNVSLKANALKINNNPSLRQSIKNVNEFKKDNSKLLIENCEKDLIRQDETKSLNRVILKSKSNQKSFGKSPIKIVKEVKDKDNKDKIKLEVKQVNENPTKLSKLLAVTKPKIKNTTKANSVKSAKKEIDKSKAKSLDKTNKEIKKNTSNKFTAKAKSQQNSSKQNVDKNSLLKQILSKNYSQSGKKIVSGSQTKKVESSKKVESPKKEVKVATIKKDSPKPVKKPQSVKNNVENNLKPKKSQNKVTESKPTSNFKPIKNIVTFNNSKSKKKSNSTNVKDVIDINDLGNFNEDEMLSVLANFDENQNPVVNEQLDNEKIEKQIQEEYTKHIKTSSKKPPTKRKSNEQIYKELLGGLVINEHAEKQTDYSFSSTPAKKPYTKKPNSKKENENDIFEFTNLKN